MALERKNCFTLKGPLTIKLNTQDPVKRAAGEDK
jgi:hypothetical protein